MAVVVVVALAIMGALAWRARRSIRADVATGEARVASAADVVIDVRDEAPRSIDDVIPGYDEMRAVDVVDALRYLEPAALDVVREHERANKARKTVLAKLDALARV